MKNIYDLGYINSLKKEKLCLGKIPSEERLATDVDHKPQVYFKIEENEITHGVITGECRSGKTELAKRFVTEVALKVRRKPSNKRMRIVCLDPKQDYRTLAKVVEPERFKFYSLGNTEFLPVNLNICKIPPNVSPHIWITGLVEIFCNSYSLTETEKVILHTNFDELYREANVFVADWQYVAPQRSAVVTLPKLYKRLTEHKLYIEHNNALNESKVNQELICAYLRVLDCIKKFGDELSTEYKLFGNQDGLSIDAFILGDDDVIVLESYGLESTFNNFIFGAITLALFKCAESHDGGFKAHDQYETLLVIEEATEVLTKQLPTDNNDDSPLLRQSEFDKILDQSADLGLFIISIAQRISSLPSSVIANSGLLFAGHTSREEDIKTEIRKIGNKDRYNELRELFPPYHIGWFICSSSLNNDFKDNKPSLVAITPLGIDTPTDNELLNILTKKL